MDCEKCDTEMDSGPSTEQYPDCNTWQCPACGHVEPEMGSFKITEPFWEPTENKE